MEEKYQCYYTDENGKRCENYSDDCWCSPKHKELEQRQRYGDMRPRGQRQLTTEQMKEGFKQMKERQRLREKMDPNGQMKI